MLLHELNNDEKKSFWVIANYLTMVDGVLQDEERELLRKYKSEMSVTYGEIHPSIVDFRNEINCFKHGPERKRKLVYFNLFGIAASDGEYTSDEERMLELVRREFSISDSDGFTLEQCSQNGEDEAKVSSVLG
ncbi:MAG: TerB family tellurite resistance protein [Lachnospiraceae bacterium]|nr:TerB family tellurite resistance protein [Lachnospiraceae bacterium]